MDQHERDAPGPIRAQHDQALLALGQEVAEPEAREAEVPERRALEHVRERRAGLALERHARALDLELRALVPRVELEPARRRVPTRGPARTSSMRRNAVTGTLSDGGMKRAPGGGASPSGVAERRRERRADARVAVAVLETAHAQVRRRHEVLERPADPARLVRRDLHVDRSEGHRVAAALDRDLAAARPTRGRA